MKNIIYIFALFSFGLSYGMNDLIKPEINDGQMMEIKNSFENLPQENIYEQFGIEAVEAVTLNCNWVAQQYLEAAFDAGYSTEECADIAMAAWAVCRFLT